MAIFRDLPRELRDLIYEFAAIDEQPILLFSKACSSKLVASQKSSALLLASKQTHTEFGEVLTTHASIILCYESNQRQVNVQTSILPTLALRTKTLTAIIELDGMKPEGWQPIGDHEAISSELQAVVGQLEKLVDIFPNLQSIEIQWWNDLSVASDRKQVGEWSSALIASGLIKTHEFWFGYLGGKLNQPAQLRQHLLSNVNLRDRTPQRAVSKGKLNLLPTGAHRRSKGELVSITPLSFF